ncbi:iron-containing alcohol dehydrogenase [Natranaerobius thermophilus]|uniref:Iron-containing alcohol dehydrogenase n=1 Tax=Natranaerobius thermophilus (strain ATCC BAA-1301 / DSM 18059 / JW/NM-WN-LF) TaxID=457570 RepID=B2A5Y8_NATTJ|nr:iron-containing alcohol dehydrogenase [Natranaerobius thermophilus]ACB85405.1 iron-containing alcohol dehydrogenase [Natranaerobius thermophilus JW/NM-WN-LF]
MIFNLLPRPPVIFGNGASYRTGMKVKELGCDKVLLVFDQGIKNAGIADKIHDNLSKAGIQVITFDGVVSDPSDDVVEEGAKLARENKVQGVIGLGGGSSLDAAKAINILLTNSSPVSQYYGINPPMNKVKPLVLIPTTAGTGSEMTTVSMVSDTEKNLKMNILSPNCLPTTAIVDPELTLRLPSQVTAETGIDTLSHAVESYLSNQSNYMTDLLNEQSIKLTFDNLPQAVKDENDLTARENMSFSSMIAGIAFSNSMVHLGHAIAHALGTAAKLSHGLGCALALPLTIEYLSQEVPERVKKIGDIMGLELDEGLSSEDLGQNVGDNIRYFIRDLGLPGTIVEAGLDEETLKQVAKLTAIDNSQIFAPKSASSQEVMELFGKP